MDVKTKGFSARTLHEIYLGIFLVAVIIILLAVKWYRIEKLVELVSFSLTITSLVLAVFAIWYSIYSGTGIERGVNNLLSAVQSVRSSAEEIESLKAALTDGLAMVNLATASIGEKIESQSGTIAKLAEQRVNAAESDQRQPPTASLFDKPAASASAADQLRRLIDSTSLSGCVALLAAARAHELKRSIDLVIPRPFSNPKYMQGYLVAVQSTEVDGIDMTMDGTVITEVRNFPLTAAEIKSLAIAKVERAKNSTVTKAKFNQQILNADEDFQADLARPPVAKPEKPSEPPSV